MKVKSKGFSLVEVLVGASIIVASLVGLLTIFGNLAHLNVQNIQNAQSAFLLEQGAEIARYWRDQNWNNISGLTAGTSYRATYASSRWSTSTVPTLIDGLFDRTIVAANVNRDSNEDIVSSGGTLDPDTRLITVTVAWRQDSATTTKTLSLYLSNIFND